MMPLKQQHAHTLAKTRADTGGGKGSEHETARRPHGLRERVLRTSCSVRNGTSNRSNGGVGRSNRPLDTLPQHDTKSTRHHSTMSITRDSHSPHALAVGALALRRGGCSNAGTPILLSPRQREVCWAMVWPGLGPSTLYHSTPIVSGIQGR